MGYRVYWLVHLFGSTVKFTAKKVIPEEVAFAKKLCIPETVPY